MNQLTINITPKSFNADKLVVSDFKEIKTKNCIKMKVSDISYENDNGEACQLFMTLPTVETFGPYPQYDFNSNKESSTDINGCTISYSNEVVNQLFTKIQKIYSKKFKKFNIKPIFSKNKKDIETAYFKLKMKGADITTEFYSDKKCTKSINGLDLVSKYGSVTPMLHLRSIYFGAHGSSDYNASFQIYIVKAIFEEKQSLTPNFKFDDTDNEYEEEY